MNSFLLKDNISHLDTRTEYGLDKKHLFYIDKDEYYISDWVGSGNFAEDKNYPVIYKINKNGFRSKHFEKLNNKKPSILFGGCSWTFGEGIPEEYTWTNLLSNKIENYLGFKIDSYNTAYMGSSIDLVIKNTMSFIRKYGKPKYIVLLFPDMARKTRYNNRTGEYIKAFPSVEWLSEDKYHVQKRYTLSYEYENNIYDNLNLIYLLEDYCEESNIKLIWSTWCIPDYIVYDDCDFKYFIKENIQDKNNYFISTLPINQKGQYYENINNWPYWQVAKDNCHPGTAWTEFMSNLFFEKMIEKKML